MQAVRSGPGECAQLDPQAIPDGLVKSRPGDEIKASTAEIIDAIAAPALMAAI